MSRILDPVRVIFVLDDFSVAERHLHMSVWKALLKCSAISHNVKTMISASTKEGVFEDGNINLMLASIKEGVFVDGRLPVFIWH